ncbi:deoxyribonuclease-1-like [Mizuhopecten yessoensis]|uniref:Deoxyribonuclease n=1 Tax=Mizuhopecten yessoensis TaxID=6573 RepID=A0A210QR66_MIZYE|nr:deoxyribonuclease-1-like [Mizuhopecten yessoensis]OWF51246.1 Deoxyribonuclease-1 [Mizuhopecten yessoensis]
MKLTMTCFRVVLLLSLATVVLCNLKIASFNIKWLSVNKLSNNSTLSVIKKILQRYDIISIIEVRSDHAIHDLVQALNMDSRDDPFGVVVSKKLGRNVHYTESYAVLFRMNNVFVQEVHQFPDNYDVFSREPYAVVFHSLDSRPSNFVYIVLHTQPSDTPAELEHMVSAYENITALLGVQNAIIAGDLNADCRYLSHTHYNTNLLQTDKRFTWLIDSDADSTVSTTTDCAYDRFIIAGDEMKNSVVPNSARVYNFQQEMNLTYNESIAVSDHFPIEMEISG